MDDLYQSDVDNDIDDNSVDMAQQEVDFVFVYTSAILFFILCKIMHNQVSVFLVTVVIEHLYLSFSKLTI